MTVEPEVPWDILISDFIMTGRTNITHNKTVEGSMRGWNRVVLHPSTLHKQSILGGYIKVALEINIMLPDNLVFYIYLSLFDLLMIFNLDNPTVSSRVDHSGKGVNSPSG